MTIRGSVENILSVYFQASPEEQEEGRLWYDVAHTEMARLGSLYGVGTSVAAGVCAALSPSCRWTNNLADTDRLLNWFTHSWNTDTPPNVHTYLSQRDKAVSILYGGRPMDVLGPRAWKTKAFYGMLYAPQRDLVVVDFHAYSIWVGERLSVEKTPSLWQAQYRRITEDYAEAAAIVGDGVKASMIQATTWVVYHRMGRDNA